MKRYQAYLEGPDGQDHGQTYDADSLVRIWSWLDLMFVRDSPAQHWWVKDRQVSETFVFADTQTAAEWTQAFADPEDFSAHFVQRWGWTANGS